MSLHHLFVIEVVCCIDLLAIIDIRMSDITYYSSNCYMQLATSYSKIVNVCKHIVTDA